MAAEELGYRSKPSGISLGLKSESSSAIRKVCITDRSRPFVFCVRRYRALSKHSASSSPSTHPRVLTTCPMCVSLPCEAGSIREATKKQTHEISRNMAKDLAGGLQALVCWINCLGLLVSLRLVRARCAKNGGHE
jgi:hypothetical protein